MKLFNIIEKMKDVRPLIVGDAIIDQYVFGRVDRVCPEGPVPVLTGTTIETRRGGAAHVMEQMDALCLPSAVSFGTPVSIKTRYMAGSHLLLRVDADKAPLLDEEQKARALLKVIGAAGHASVVVLSDYGKGWLSEQMCQFLIRFAKERKIPVVVDPKGGSWAKYSGCTVICPNDKEVSVPGLGIPFVLHKRGADGLRLYDPVMGPPPPLDAPLGAGRVYLDFPSTTHHVADVTGAGDIVVAVFAGALAAGASMGEAATLANLAAGWSVGEIGTVVCSRETLHALAKEYENGSG